MQTLASAPKDSALTDYNTVDGLDLLITSKVAFMTDISKLHTKWSRKGNNELIIACY